MLLSQSNHPKDKPFDRLVGIGVALMCRPPRGRRPEVRHVGILFRDPTQRVAAGEVKLLHLAFHHDMRVENPGEEYGWLELPLSKERTPAVVGLCRLLVEKYVNGDDRIAFAPRYAGCRFDPISGRFVPEGAHGLTCATFVMAVFASHGIELLKREEWPPRTDDLDWFQQILRQLADPRHGATPEHIQAVESDIGCARFRPQEVAAAGTAATPDALPLAFEEARRTGELLVEALLARH